MTESELPYRIVSRDQYFEERATKLTPEDLVTDRSYDIRLIVSKNDEAAFAIDSLSHITSVMPHRNHFIVVRKQVRDGIVSPLENTHEVFPNGIIFRANRKKIYECGYFLSALTDEDISALGLTSTVKNGSRQPAPV